MAFRFSVSFTALVLACFSGSVHAGDLTPQQKANLAAAEALIGVWMQSKDLPAGAQQEAGLQSFSSFMDEEVEIGVLPQGESKDIPFAREFYGKSGAETFARLHWNTVRADYNTATGGAPVKFEFLSDNVIHAVNRADVVVRSNGCPATLVIDETWTFTPDHRVRAAKFSYATNELDRAFRFPARCK